MGGVGGQGSGARLSLPKIHFGGQRNVGGANYVTDSAARGGALGGPPGRNAMMVGQQSPFVGKPGYGNELDHMNPIHGKMTPMYEKQQQRFGASAKKGGANMFAGGFNQPA